MSGMKRTGGFTLLEILVSVSIFSVAVIIGVGAILSISDANRRARSMQTTMDNLSFAIEVLVREMRLGSQYSCGLYTVPTDCPESGDSISFVNSEGNRVAYRVSAGRMERSESVGSGSISDEYRIMTSPDITIERLTFYVAGAPAADSAQPRAIVSIRGSVRIDPVRSSTFTVQTMVTQRNVDS